MEKKLGSKDLEVYQFARQVSELSWKIYSTLSFENKKIMIDQFIRSSDSTGANIAEGFGRYYYLDKIRFFYNSRGSLSDASDHWLELLHQRQKIDANEYQLLKQLFNRLLVKLNNLISTTYKQTKKGKK